MSQPVAKRIIIRKVLKTEDDILRFCRANKSTILACGQYLYCFEEGNFSEVILRWFFVNDSLDAAFNAFGCIKLNSQQIGKLLEDLVSD